MFKFVLAVALAFGALAGAQAQGYPNRPVKIVVPFPPAGVTDILGRLVAERLATAWGQGVVVDNRPGASGHIGAQQVAQAAGDGYTLMVGTIGIHAAYGSYRKLAYDPAKDLQPIMVLGEAPNVVLVPASSAFKTFGDLLAAIKATPGKINYASAGPGSSIHMVTALFELHSDSRMTHVPYKGSGPALIDLIGGQVDVMFENMSSGMPHIKSGKLRPLAVTTAARHPNLPDVPTIDEAGVPGYSAGSWFSLAAPRDVPTDLVKRINDDVTRVLGAPDAIARLNTLGMSFKPNTPAEAAAYFKSETAKWNRVIQAANLQLD